MNGEPFCYGTRLTVRNVLEMRSNGLTPSQMLAEHPELRVVGIAEAFASRRSNRERYADFFENDGTLRGPGFTAEEAAGCRRTCALRPGSWSHAASRCRSALTAERRGPRPIPTPRVRISDPVLGC